MRFVRTAESLFSIPSGFTRVEYLESTGTQYINLGVGVKANTVFKATFSVASTATGRSYFGARNSVDERFQIVNSIGIGGGYYLANNVYPVANKKYEIEMHANGDMYLDGVKRNATTGTFSQVAFERNLWLFATNYYDSSVGAGASTFWKVQIYEGDALVRDLIPCIDPLGVACMYDLVGKKPYYNQGTGTFTAGRQVIPVEYLESTGTQYIDTGVGGDLTTELTCEAAIVQAGNASVTNIMGNNVTSTRAITINMSANITNPSPSRIRFGNTDNTTEAGAIDLNTFYKYTTNKDNLTVKDSSGTVLNTYPLNATTAFTTNGNILIYKLGDTSTQYIGNIKVKCATIKNNGVLVRDFIPCKDENNVGFMFDTLSGTVYLNAGTGAFSVGENKYTSKLRLIKDAIRLPDGYTRVEYLESSGTQYIDTGYIPTNTTGVQVRHTICADNSKDNIVFGCREGSGDTRFWEDIDWTNSDTIGWGFNSYSSTTAGTRFLISGMAGQTIVSSMNFMNDRAGRVNGVPYDTSLETKTLITITRPICLFAANYAGTMSLFTACKIFSCQISEGSTLVRSFIPVRDENNVGYMFDEVTRQIFGNAGSGSFGIGNDLPTAKVRFIQDVLPREYRPLKYLQSTGTQYIDTGFYPTQLTEVEYCCAVTGNVSNADSHLFGSRLSASSEAFDLAYMNTQPNGIEKFRFIHGTTTTQETTTSVTASQLANPHTYYMSGTSFKVDGSEKMSFTTSSFTGSYSLWLFGVNSAGSLHNQVRAQRVYKCIIWDNGVTVRDLYPALRKSDNKVGMYDRITKQFFTNASTSGNDFNYG